MARVIDQNSQSPQTTEIAPAQTCGEGILRAPKNQPGSSRHKVIALVTLVLLAVVVRLPGISRPLLGQFATKNVIYAMIARNWARGQAPFWLPTVDCTVAGERSWHLLEIPVATYLAAEGWAICGGSLDVWGRAVSVAFSAGAVALLYLLVRRWHGECAACVAALLLSLSPISILCGQSFMLEASAVFFMLLAMWSIENWLSRSHELVLRTGAHGGPALAEASLSHPTRSDEERRASSWGWWMLATASVALMLCTKVYLVVMLLPLGVMAMHAARTADIPRRRIIVGGWAAMAILGVLPAIIWCSMVATIASRDNPLSAHVYYSLSRSAAVNSLPNPLLLKSAFYLQLLKSLAGAGLTPIGLLLAMIGALDGAWRRHAGWLAALATLIILLPGKFFELRYYTLILVPVLSVLAGLGWDLLSRRLRAPRFVAVACLIAGLGCSLWLVAGPAWTTPQEDRAVTVAAQAVREISPVSEPVATLHGAAPDLLYYCDRPGWALSVNDRHFAENLEQCRQFGARFLVVADVVSLVGKPAAEVIERLPIECSGDDYRIYRLPAPAKTVIASPLETRSVSEGQRSSSLANASGYQPARLRSTAGRPAAGRIR